MIIDGIAIVPLTTPGLDAVLLLAPDLSRRGLASSMRRLEAENAGVPRVLATAWTPANLRWLTDYAVDDVIPVHRLALELRPAIERLAARSPMERMAREVECARHVREELRIVLTVALRARPPIRSVQRLAWNADLKPSTLFKLWRRQTPEARLSDLVHIILLIRMLERRDNVESDRQADREGRRNAAHGRATRAPLL